MKIIIPTLRSAFKNGFIPNHPAQVTHLRERVEAKGMRVLNTPISVASQSLGHLQVICKPDLSVRLTDTEFANFLRQQYENTRRIVRYAGIDQSTLVEELVHDSFLSLMEKYRDKSLEELKALLYVIARNKVRDVQRRNKAAIRTISINPQETNTEGDSYDLLALYEDRQDAPDLLLERNQMLETLNRIVQSMPPRQREAFMGHIIERCNAEDLARRMGCQPGTIKTHIRRAMALLGQEPSLNDFCIAVKSKSPVYSSRSAKP